MLDIRLEDAIQCYNPSCRAVIDSPGDSARYCPRCGAAQVFECTACPTRPGALIPVADECECPRCGSLYVRCAACLHPLLVTVDRPLSCPDGCADGFSCARGGTSGPLAGPQRTGSIACAPSVDELPAPSVWRLGEAVGKPVCAYGRIYVPTVRGTIRALSDATGADVGWWSQHAVFPRGTGLLHTLDLQVSERFVSLSHQGHISAISAIDGDRCFSVQSGLENVHTVIRDDRLLVCGLSPEPGLTVELYDTTALVRGQDGLLSRLVLNSDTSGTPHPVDYPTVAGSSFLVRDLAGNIVEICEDHKKEYRLIWANDGYQYVSVPGVLGDYAFALAHSMDRGAAVLSIRVSDGGTKVGRAAGARAAYIGLRIGTNGLFFYDEARDFYQFDPASMLSPPGTIFHGVEATGDTVMDDLLLLEGTAGEGAWLVSMVSENGESTARMVHASLRSRPSIACPGEGKAALAASDRRMYLANMQTGEFLVYPIPRR